MGHGVILVLLLFLGTTRAFTQKSECVLDYRHTGLGEYEGEDHEDGRPGGHDAYGGGGGGGGVGGGGEAYRGEYHPSSEEDEDSAHGEPRPAINFNSPRSDWERGHIPRYRQGGRRYLDEEGEWEDARKRKRRGDGEQEYNTGHIRDSLTGRLSCAADSVIHVLNVTVGYSNTQHCYQAFPGCQAGSSSAKQVIGCQGNVGVCQVTVGRHFMMRCGQQTNFALVYYECIPATKRVDICSNTNSDIPDALVVTSSNYPRSSNFPSTGNSDIVACECTLRAPANSHLELEYLRTHLPMSGSTCSGDMLLLERPDPVSEGRYLMEREICGQNVTNHLVIADYILRVTFLTGAPLIDSKSGFIAKFKALSAVGTPETFHVSCAGAHQGTAADSQGKLVLGRSQSPGGRLSTPASNQTAYTDRLVEWMKVNGRTLPPNLDPTNLPANFFNMSREELQSRLLQTRAQSQKILGAHSDDSQTMQASEDTALSSSSSSGVLSGVVASLSSVVLILGSIGALIFYRRHQRKTLQEKQAQQMAPTILGSSPWAKDASKLGVISGASRKNKDRPLPQPVPDIRESTEPRSMSRPRSAGPGCAVICDATVADSKVMKLNHLSKNGVVSPGIYSIAVSMPDPVEGSDVPNDDAQTTPQSSTAAPTLRSQDAAEDFGSTAAPLAPPRTKRHDVKGFTKEAVDYSSPYDNALTNSASAQDKIGSAEGGNPTLLLTKSAALPTHNKPGLERSEANFNEEEEENYSYIYDIQVDGDSAPGEDNTEV